ncbi:MAG: sugar phosphate isomerase/epimerase family protein [Massiliimalia sp.]|jgi:inosose dehydratase
MMKVAYTGWTWVNSQDPETARRQVEQSFRECKFLGYDYVENFAFIRDYYVEDPQVLVKLAADCGVNLVNLYGHFTFDIENAIKVGKEQIDFLAEVGGKWYNCQNSGFGDDGPTERPTNPEMIDKMCTVANELGRYGKEKGVTLCFHPHYGTCVFSQSDIDYFAEHTNPDYVSFCFDTAHTTLAGMNPVDLIHQYGSRIGYIHLKDVDTFALSKAEGPAKMASFRALGHGTVNFPAVKAALEEEGYDGVLCVELDRPEVCNFHSAEVSRIYIRDVLGL